MRFQKHCASAFPFSRTAAVWLVLVAGLCLFCFFQNTRFGSIPKNYVARAVVYDDGISPSQTSPPERYKEYYIYRDKTYICIEYSLSDDHGQKKTVQKKTPLRDWEDLRPLLGEIVSMNEGDVAIFTVEQFIRYMNDLYF